MEDTFNKIKNIVLEEHEHHFTGGALDEFNFDHKILANEYPNGAKEYYGLQLSELKKEYLKEYNDPNLRNWIRSDCFCLSTIDNIILLIDFYTKIFDLQVESLDHDFSKGFYKDGETINHLYDLQLKHIKVFIRAFFLKASKITALIDALKSLEPETKNQHTLNLWHYIDQKYIPKIQQTLVKEGRWSGEGTFFTPINKGSRYEPASFVQALIRLKILKIELPPNEMIKILMRTFEGFNCNTKTFRKGSNHDATIEYYKGLCKPD